MNVGEVVRAIYRRGPSRRTPCDVLRALAEHVDDAGTCFPSHALLARKCRVTPRTVISSLAWLTEEGWISVERGQGMPGRRKRGRTNLYHLNLKRILGNAFMETVSSETPSHKTVSMEKISHGKPVEKTMENLCKIGGKPVNHCGKPVNLAISSEIFSPEIDCNPPTPPNLYNTQEKQKTKAKAKAKAYDGEARSRLTHSDFSPTALRRVQ